LTKQLENVAINDVLLLKAARRCAIANVECFGAPEHQRPHFDGWIYIRCAAPPYSARIRAIYLLPSGKVWLSSVIWSVCEKFGYGKKGRIFEGWVKTPIQF